jgi:hypothetical protein
MEWLSKPFPNGNDCPAPTSKTYHSSKLLTIVNFERMAAQRGRPFYLKTTESDSQEE